MTRSEKRILFLAMVIVLALAAWKLVPMLEKRGRPQGEAGCDALLWSFVYHRQRLEIIEPCKTVEGVIDRVLREADGDLHMRLDVEDKSLMNERNFSGQHGMLVLETIC